MSTEPNTEKYRLQIRDAVLRNSGLGIHGIQQAEGGRALAAGDIQEAQRRAMQLSYPNLRSKKARFDHERNPGNHCLEAVGILNQGTDKEDRCLVYGINNSKLNGEPVHIFKSSTPMPQLAIDMDQDGPEHPLQGVETYFDGSYLQHVDYKTLVLFMYHPAMQCILRCITMKVKNESTCDRS